MPEHTRSFLGLKLCVYVALLLLTLSIRLPFFFTSTINWDESTYILLGQSLLDGHLPYTNLWEIKPPLAFAPYALFIAFLGKSIVAIRLGGVIFVWISACLIYELARSHHGQRAGLISAALLVVFSTAYPGAPVTNLEILCLVPVSAGLYLMLSREWSLANAFTIGLLFSAATLIRLNLAYLAVGVAIVFFTEVLRRKNTHSLVAFLGLGLGGVLLPILIALAYYVDGNLDLLRRSVIDAPLAYASPQGSFGLEDIHGFLFLAKKGYGFANIILWLPAAVTIACILLRHRDFALHKRYNVILLFLFAATLFSILKSGRYAGHYLIQILPFLALLAAQSLSLLVLRTRTYAVVAILVVFFVSPLVPVGKEYSSLFRKIRTEDSVYTDTGYKIARYLNSKNVEGEYVYFTHFHIGYWLTNSIPPTKFVHPSNLAKRNGQLLKAIDGADASPRGEMDRILAKKPIYIVKPYKLWFLREAPETEAVLENALETDYELVKRVDGIRIFRHNSRRSTSKDVSTES